MNTTKKQTGSVHLIVIILLSVALIGTLGVVYYQNFIMDTDKDETSLVTDETPSGNNVKTNPVVGPVTVMDEFMSSYTDHKKLASGDNSDSAFATKTTYMTDAYKDRVINPTGLVTTSPIILAQDILTSFSIGNAKIESDTSTVPVTLYYGGSVYEITYTLVVENGEWKVDSVTK